MMKFVDSKLPAPEMNKYPSRIGLCLLLAATPALAGHDDDPEDSQAYGRPGLQR